MKLNNEQLSLGASAMKFFTGLILSLKILSAPMVQAKETAPPLVEKLYDGTFDYTT